MMQAQRRECLETRLCEWWNRSVCQFRSSVTCFIAHVIDCARQKCGACSQLAETGTLARSLGNLLDRAHANSSKRDLLRTYLLVSQAAVLGRLCVLVVGSRVWPARPGYFPQSCEQRHD